MQIWKTSHILKIQSSSFSPFPASWKAEDIWGRWFGQLLHSEGSGGRWVSTPRGRSPPHPPGPEERFLHHHNQVWYEASEHNSFRTKEINVWYPCIGSGLGNSWWETWVPFERRISTALITNYLVKTTSPLWTIKSHCLGCFCVLAIVNRAAMNIVVHDSFWIMVFSGYMSSGIAGLYGSSIFSF